MYTMKSDVLLRLLMLAVVLLPASACIRQENRACRAERIVAQMHDPDSKQVLVISHRADWRNWPENSIPGIESAIRMGVDIVELDIQMTKDSVLVLCHDRTVNRTTTGKGLVSDFTLDSIKTLRLKKGHGVACDIKMPTLREALECCRGRVVINIDKGYEHYDQVLALTEELGVTDQILIKGKRPMADVKADMDRHSHNLMYMPVINIRKPSGKELFDSYMRAGTVPIAYEVCFDSWDEDVKECMRKVVDGGSKLWVNTLWPSLCGGPGWDDDAAYTAADPGEVYGRYIDLGVTMIQTDRPEMLIKYLRSRGLHD